jgi:anti-sigma regulatory factor (Ser/Thr protein kinase)
MATRLIPTPHMLKSIRSRNWNLEGAIEELVDNSFGHGRAKKVGVVIDNKLGIGVIDDGIGVDDINRIFRLGDAGAYDVLSEIGQYGVGAKNATIYLGDTVSVDTNRDGRRYRKTVHWKKVEESGEWPLAYTGSGQPVVTDKHGTTIVVKDLAHHYKLVSSERLAKELGRVFAPALRAGGEILVHHRLARGDEQTLAVKPFTPPDMTNEIQIGGEIETGKGKLKWSGRAGLSESLTERNNGVHIAFGHRIIEVTREPFYGESAPTLYCEVMLDDTTPWKHSLSEHKDKVVRNRAELIDGIYAQIRPLLEKSAQQASALQLSLIATPIEQQLTRALKGAGILSVEPEEEPTEPAPEGSPRPEPPDELRPKLFPPANDGDEAEAAGPPTGVMIDWRTREQLEDKLFSWEITGRQMLILLDEDQFKPTIGFPPRLRELHVIQLVAAILAHAIEAEYRLDRGGLIRAVTPGLRRQLDEWDTQPSGIAPYLNRAILEAV